MPSSIPSPPPPTRPGPRRASSPSPGICAATASNRSSSAPPRTTCRPFREFRTIAGAPLAEIKRLLASASLFAGNDSGPAHMAAAFGLPVVVIFGASDPAIWGPWRTASEVVTSPAGIAGVEVSSSARRAGAPAGARMKELLRLLAYARRYWAHLAASVVLMAVAGAAQGMMALLIKSDLRPRPDRRPARRTHSAAGQAGFRPSALSRAARPASRPQRLDHGGVRHPRVLPHQGHLRLPGQLPGQLRRLLLGHGPAQRGLRQGAASRARSSSNRTPPAS